MESTNEEFEKPNDPRVAVDYFVVVVQGSWFFLSREMVQAVEATLNEAPTPAWVTFVDLSGARVRVRTRLVEYVFQCTAEQRALERAFHRARRAERKAEADWDDE